MFSCILLLTLVSFLNVTYIIAGKSVASDIPTGCL